MFTDARRTNFGLLFVFAALFVLGTGSGAQAATTPCADLLIDGVTTVPAQLVQGQPASVNVTVRNAGTCAAGGFAVLWRSDLYSADGTLVPRTEPRRRCLDHGDLAFRLSPLGHLPERRDCRLREYRRRDERVQQLCDQDVVGVIRGGSDRLEGGDRPGSTGARPVGDGVDHGCESRAQPRWRVPRRLESGLGRDGAVALAHRPRGRGVGHGDHPVLLRERGDLREPGDRRCRERRRRGERVQQHDGVERDGATGPARPGDHQRRHQPEPARGQERS